MNKYNQEIIDKTIEYVKKTLSGESSGHDWWHIFRVWKNAKHILQTENDADRFVVELAVLLHDIQDWKFSNDELEGDRIIKKWLLDLGVDKKIIVHICDIVANVSYKGADVKSKILTLEGKIVQDADRLDAIGAIGIGRAFAYGGNKGKEMHNPEIKSDLHDYVEKSKSNKGTTINHFYEKLLLLTDLMNTKSAKNIAKKRHKFMELYLDQFYREWNGVA